MNMRLFICLILIQFNSFGQSYSPLYAPPDSVTGVRQAVGTQSTSTQLQYDLSKGVRRTWINLYQDCKAPQFEIKSCTDVNQCPRFRGLRRVPDTTAVYDPRQVSNPALLRSTHPILSQRTDSPACNASLVKPTCFAFSSHPSYSAATGLAVDAGTGTKKDIVEYDPITRLPVPSEIKYGFVANPQFPNGQDDCRALSCAAYVSTALLAANLRLFKPKTPGGRPVESYKLNTSMLRSMYKGNEPNFEPSRTCLEPPTLRADQLTGKATLPPLIVGNGNGHSFIVEEQPAGDKSDPFGIEKALKRQNGCNSIAARDLSFKISQSSAMLGTIPSVGLVRTGINTVMPARNEETGNLRGGTTTVIYEQFRNFFLTLARRMCREAEMGRSRPIRMKEIVDSINDGTELDEDGRDPGFFMLVPKAQDPECKRERVNFSEDGDKCEKSCGA